MRALVASLLGSVFVLGCGTTGGVWDGEIATYGSLRGMFHESATAAAVNLETLLPDDTLYAVGAIEELRGEVTILAGRAYLSYPEGEASRVELVDRSQVGAALLVAARVPAWESFTTEQPIAFEALDAAIAELSVRAGWNENARFPFLVEGRFERLDWHVIDGRRLAGGAGSHRDHLAASVTHSSERVEATLVGFYSSHDRGVFTHADSRTHLHCIVAEPSAAGHVDHVAIDAGATIRFPRAGR